MFGHSRRKLIDKFKASWGKPKTEEFNFELIEHYFKKKNTATALQIISNQTVHDIDFKNLFMFVDRTSSRIGQQYLLSNLLTIPKTPGFDEQEKIIEHFAANGNDCQNAQFILSRLNDDKSYHVATLFLEDFVEPPKILPLIKVLSIIGLVTFIATFFILKIGFVLIGLFTMNLYLHYSNKKHIEMYSDSIPRLSLLCRCIRELLKMKLPGGSTDTIISSLESIEKLNSKMSVFTIEGRQAADPIAAAVYMIIEYVKIQFLVEPIIVFSALKNLRNNRNDIQNLYEYFGKIDLAISIASLRHGLKYFCKPKISPDFKGIGFIDIYHPLIPNCIPNTMAATEQSIILTGSNMSGKSTFIRSVTINTLFAQTINTCFATDFQLSPLQILSAIRISDDVLSGKSYYFEEVLAINKMVKESQTGIKTLFLLDEIFKGTNTIERIAAGKAVLSYICKNGNIVFVSTHDIELTGLLGHNYDLFHFTEIVVDGVVHFDYKLKNGELKTRNAIKILEINGYPEDLIKEANEISNKIVGYSTKIN